MKKFFLVSIIFLLILGLVFGCATEQRVQDDNNPNRNGVNDQNPIDNNQDNEQNMDVVPGDRDNDNDNIVDDNDNDNDENDVGDDQSEQEQAEEIAEIAQKVQGVKDATVLVTGDTAYVGIDIDNEIEDEQTNDLKDRVAEQIKEDEESTDRVFVSADADTVSRLQEMVDDIGEGRPVSGFLNELTEMFRRPAPTTE